jgi:mannan endo-1,4-beta-mannosidase
MFRRILFSLLLASPACAKDVHFLMMPDQVIGPISPYIYGVNDVDPAGLNLTVRRLGGNRMTGYNWVNNASNAGSDWHQTSDNWLCDSHHETDCDQPGAFARHFVQKDREDGLATLMTIPIAGYVAADKDGVVSEAETAPSRRWKKIEFHKHRPYTLQPDPQSPVVYEDEFVNYLVSNFKKAGEGGVQFYDLDNEPGIWSTTHPRLHPQKTGYWELINKTEAAADNILRVDPTALIFGGVLYGWQAYLTLQNSPDSESLDKTFGTFLDFYLAQIRNLERRHHKRLVQVLDLHWYPEAQGAGKRITEGDVSPDSREARVQAPRSLWDPGYVEKSWITQWSTKGQAIQLIPWVKEKIDKYCPGTKLAFSEYDYGAGNDVSGGLAQADVLGIFGKYGIFLSCYWGDLKPYNRAAFELYRNYDGRNGSFGDTAVSAATEDVSETSCYASIDTQNPGVLWVVALNKDLTNQVQGKFDFQGAETYRTYQAYGFDGKSAEVRLLKSGNLQKDHLDYPLPPLSATLFVCRGEASAPGEAAPGEHPAQTPFPNGVGQ